jgi:hypothetical protein
MEVMRRLICSRFPAFVEFLLHRSPSPQPSLRLIGAIINRSRSNKSSNKSPNIMSPKAAANIIAAATVTFAA